MGRLIKMSFTKIPTELKNDYEKLVKWANAGKKNDKKDYYVIFDNLKNKLFRVDRFQLSQQVQRHDVNLIYSTVSENIDSEIKNLMLEFKIREIVREQITEYIDKQIIKE